MSSKSELSELTATPEITINHVNGGFEVSGPEALERVEDLQNWIRSSFDGYEDQCGNISLLNILKFSLAYNLDEDGVKQLTDMLKEAASMTEPNCR